MIHILINYLSFLVNEVVWPHQQFITKKVISRNKNALIFNSLWRQRKNSFKIIISHSFHPTARNITFPPAIHLQVNFSHFVFLRSMTQRRANKKKYIYKIFKGEKWDTERGNNEKINKELGEMNRKCQRQWRKNCLGWKMPLEEKEEKKIWKRIIFRLCLIHIQSLLCLMSDVLHFRDKYHAWVCKLHTLGVFNAAV